MYLYNVINVINKREKKQKLYPVFFYIAALRITIDYVKISCDRGNNITAIEDNEA